MFVRIRMYINVAKQARKIVALSVLKELRN